MPNKPDHPKHDAKRRRWRLAWIVVLVLVAIGAWWKVPEVMATANSQADSSAQSLAAAQGQAGQSFLSPAVGVDRAAPLQQGAEQLSVLQSQLALAEETLERYRAGTKYPQESRPAAEHADQLYPNRPVEEERAMHMADGKADASVQIKTSQTRIYVGGGETVTFSIKAQDRSGETLPLLVTRAVAQGLTFQGSRGTPQIALPFADDGGNGDAAAGDGILSATLAPAMTGLANFDGTIRVTANYHVGDRAGVTFFDIIHTPQTPAVWSGSIREAVEDGSLIFYLKAEVRQAGRYLVNARVDDAQGKPFALLNFNEMLSAGPQEIRLPLFGKLIHDQAPAFPLRLRDVDGYLLKEDTDPDRALMPRLPGVAYVTKAYSPKIFSDEEWQSEQRSRYLAEFEEDVKRAKLALQQ
jgi:hypothetical protein